MHLPGPPLLKTTIIQLNKDIDPEDNNYEILTNEWSPATSFAASPQISDEQPRKKRRRSSLFVDDEELARRRHETKQLHLIIEKRRRIKINREFEALKYLIPACRNTDQGTKRNLAHSNNNNGSKIDGMYKLTILKLAVEYILYLHHIVQKQHQMLSLASNYKYDVAFASIPLDVNQYRNIDREFDFGELAVKAAEVTRSENQKFESRPVEFSRSEKVRKFEPITEEDSQPRAQRIPRAKLDTFATKLQLLTPDVTPDIAPILSLLSKYSGDTQQLIAQQLKEKTRRDFELSAQTVSQTIMTTNSSSSMTTNSSSAITSNPSSTVTSNPSSTVTSNSEDFHHDIDALNKTFSFNSMQKSGSISSSTSPFTVPIKSQIKRSNFYLPDPAISELDSLPKKMYFREKIPAQNSVANVGEELDGKLEDALKTLLTLRKPSIEKLLN